MSAVASSSRALGRFWTPRGAGREQDLYQPERLRVYYL